MLTHIQELLRYRDLLWRWLVRSIKIKYKQSVLGVAWAIIQPLSSTVLFSVVFSRFVPVDTGGIPYPIFYFSALLPWTFFATSVSLAVPSLVSNMNLVTKVYFPREILPIAEVAAGFVDFCIGAVVFVGMMVFYRVPVGTSMLLMPVVVAIQTLLTLGVVLLGASLMVFYRDIRFVIPLGLQMWMYVTPIIYPVSIVPERFRLLYMLNPMAGIIDAYRTIILSADQPHWGYLALSCAMSLALFIASYVYFKAAEAQFADYI